MDTPDAVASGSAGYVSRSATTTAQNLVGADWYRGCSRRGLERTLMATALAYATSSPAVSEVSTTLTVGAGVAYEIFSDAVEIPRWLPIVQASRTLVRYPAGRPHRAAFTR